MQAENERMGPFSPCSRDHALLAAVFERAGVGLCLVGPDNQVIMANSEWLNSVGLTAEQVDGKSIIELLPEVRSLADTLRRYGRKGETVDAPRRQLRAAGRERYWEDSAAPVPMPGALASSSSPAR